MRSWICPQPYWGAISAHSTSCAWKASATVPCSGRSAAAFSADSRRLFIGWLLFSLHGRQLRHGNSAQRAPVGERGLEVEAEEFANHGFPFCPVGLTYRR